MVAEQNGKPRIVIYGTGHYGGLVAGLAIEKGWEVVAAFNRAGDKIGQDLGRLSGLDRDIGVIVQDCDRASFDGLDADIGVVTLSNNLEVNVHAYRRLMNAGLNVICHGTESYYPWGCNSDLAQEIDALAKENGVTFTGSGIWDMSRIWTGIIMAGACTEINSIYHKSITDFAGQTTPEQAENWGVGISPEEFEAKGLSDAKVYLSYKTIPEHVLFALGYTITDTRVRVEPIILEEPFDSSDFLGRVIPTGKVIGTRVIGEVETSEGTTGTVHMEARLFSPDEQEHNYWKLDGKPRSRVVTERFDSAHATAANLFNRIPQVIRAEPGIVLLSQLGPQQHTALL